MYTRAVKNVEYFRDSWRITLDTEDYYWCKFKPPYVVGDTIVEYGTFLSYMERLNTVPHFEWEKEARRKVCYV